MKKILMTLLALFIALGAQVWGAGLNCQICGMMIPEDSKNHIIAHVDKAQSKTLHICSQSCLKGAKKKYADLSQIQIANFHLPQQMIPAEKAYFLVGSEKIKADLGDMVMPPYFGAFASEKEAKAAQKKYGDGKVVKGLQKLLELK